MAQKKKNQQKCNKYNHKMLKSTKLCPNKHHYSLSGPSFETFDDDEAMCQQ